MQQRVGLLAVAAEFFKELFRLFQRNNDQIPPPDLAVPRLIGRPIDEKFIAREIGKLIVPIGDLAIFPNDHRKIFHDLFCIGQQSPYEIIPAEHFMVLLQGNDPPCGIGGDHVHSAVL